MFTTTRSTLTIGGPAQKESEDNNNNLIYNGQQHTVVI